MKPGLTSASSRPPKEPLALLADLWAAAEAGVQLKIIQILNIPGSKISKIPCQFETWIIRKFSASFLPPRSHENFYWRQVHYKYPHPLMTKHNRFVLEMFVNRPSWCRHGNRDGLLVQIHLKLKTAFVFKGLVVAFMKLYLINKDCSMCLYFLIFL